MVSQGVVVLEEQAMSELSVLQVVPVVLVQPLMVVVLWDITPLRLRVQRFCLDQ